MDLVGRAEAFPLERGGAAFSPVGSQGWQAAAGGGGGGGKDNYAVWRRYADIVQEVVSAWCRDPATFDLDPLWLLPKLRVHRNW